MDILEISLTCFYPLVSGVQPSGPDPAHRRYDGHRRDRRRVARRVSSIAECAEPVQPGHDHRFRFASAINGSSEYLRR